MSQAQMDAKARDLLMDLERENAELRKALDALTSEPDMLAYPVRDVYGSSRREDREAELWTESGLYGRLGSQAARTMLVRHGRACALLGKKPLHGWGQREEKNHA